LGRGVPLSVCLFLTISAYVIGKVARDALFLTQFSAVQLPYADIASGVLVGFVVALYLQVGRRTSLTKLVVGSQLVFAATSSLFLVSSTLTTGWPFSTSARWPASRPIP
jgi:hypothetical protein